MKKTKSKCGYVVYETNLTECVRITDGYGICDRMIIDKLERRRTH